MKALKWIYLYGQLVFALIFDVWAVFMLLRCIIQGSDKFYWVCFAAMILSTWFLMVKSSWREIQEEKGGRNA